MHYLTSSSKYTILFVCLLRKSKRETEDTAKYLSIIGLGNLIMTKRIKI